MDLRIFSLCMMFATLCASCAARSENREGVAVLSKEKNELNFVCKYEVFPDSSRETDKLFKYARWLQEGNQLKRDEVVDAEIERLYRIAAENGNFKANVNLQNGSMQGRYKLRGEEHIRLSQELIDAGVATGYFFIAVFLQKGLSGLQEDREMALRYFRKAADEGSAEAQYYVGSKLEPSDMATEIAMRMYLCAAEQGHGESAVSLGVYRKRHERYQDALEAFQLGVASGNSSSASFLAKAFRATGPEDELFYLGVQHDSERAERYVKVWRALADYSYANPKVPEINHILPLPPERLPSWDGKLQWLVEREAKVMPSRPSEALIRKLARNKFLEPSTGKPTPASSSFVAVNSPAPTCISGQECPESGYWQAVRLVDDISLEVTNGKVIYTRQNEVMPSLVVGGYGCRVSGFRKEDDCERRVVWRLLG